MRTKKMLSGALGAALLTLIGCNATPKQESAPVEETFSGLVGEATSMHVLQVILGNDTLEFQMNDDCDKADGNLVIGNLVEVDYITENNVNIAKKIVGNATYVNALGTWTKPIDGMEGVEGVELGIGGVAASVNMHTLVYKAWGITDEENMILLQGESIGNGQTIEFTDTAYIKQVDEKWIMEFPKNEVVYTKE